MMKISSDDSPNNNNPNSNNSNNPTPNNTNKIQYDYFTVNFSRNSNKLTGESIILEHERGLMIDFIVKVFNEVIYKLALLRETVNQKVNADIYIISLILLFGKDDYRSIQEK